jgi:hypothetical protein
MTVDSLMLTVPDGTNMGVRNAQHRFPGRPAATGSPVDMRHGAALRTATDVGQARICASLIEQDFGRQLTVNS